MPLRLLFFLPYDTGSSTTLNLIHQAVSLFSHVLTNVLPPDGIIVRIHTGHVDALKHLTGKLLSTFRYVGHCRELDT